MVVVGGGEGVYGGGMLMDHHVMSFSWGNFEYLLVVVVVVVIRNS